METTVELKPEHLTFVEKLAKKHGFEKFNLELSNGSKKGENYLSQIILATLKDEKKNKSLNLVLKLASDNETLRKQIDIITGVFSREAYIYETVFPVFREYQKERGIESGFETTARGYGSDLTYPREVVVLENMRIRNYKLWDRRHPMNQEHIFLVLSNYAKLHAVSFAMSQLNPDKFGKLTANMDNNWLPATKEKFEIGFAGIKPAFDRAERALDDLDTEKMAFKKFVKNLPDIMVDELTVTPEDDLVITHGDCWCNNMLFKYDDPENPNKPTKVCLIDWQLSGKRSPAMDLSYFLCCSVSGKDLSKNLDQYLRFYYDRLSEDVLAFGGNLGDVFSYSLLEKHFKKYSRFGFYMSIALMKMLVHEDGEEFSLEDIHASDDKDAGDKIFASEMKNEKLYKERLIDIVSFMTEKEYI